VWPIGFKSTLKIKQKTFAPARIMKQSIIEFKSTSPKQSNRQPFFHNARILPVVPVRIYNRECHRLVHVQVHATDDTDIHKPTMEEKKKSGQQWNATSMNSVRLFPTRPFSNRTIDSKSVPDYTDPIRSIQ